MAEEQHPPQPTAAGNQPEGNLLPGVKHIIAVSSGKGGVGKTTVTVNMAVALKQEGYAVGVMDADIYGPNIPMMIGVTKEPVKEGDNITPAEGQGVKVISMGFFVPEDTPVVWRGPMVHTAIQQFFRDVVWGELDYLLIDLPPGTGDVPLTLSQLVPLTGAVTVTTPQEVALSDVRKGMMMFKKVNVPLLGIVENMSYFVCGHCGERSEEELRESYRVKDRLKQSFGIGSRLPMPVSVSMYAFFGVILLAVGVYLSYTRTEFDYLTLAMSAVFFVMAAASYKRFRVTCRTC